MQSKIFKMNFKKLKLEPDFLLKIKIILLLSNNKNTYHSVFAALLHCPFVLL